MGLSLPNNITEQLQLTKSFKNKIRKLKAYIQLVIISTICIFLTGIMFKMSYF